MDSIDPNSKEDLDCIYELFNRNGSPLKIKIIWTIVGFFAGTYKMPPGVHHFWTSATDTGCDKNWGFCTYNRSTIPLNPYIPWAENEPSDLKCAALRIDSRKVKPKFEFVAKKCSEQLRYICKVRSSISQFFLESFIYTNFRVFECVTYIMGEWEIPNLSKGNEIAWGLLAICVIIIHMALLISMEIGWGKFSSGANFRSSLQQISGNDGGKRTWPTADAHELDFHFMCLYTELHWGK